jgi:hypothetical protein
MEVSDEISRIDWDGLNQEFQGFEPGEEFQEIPGHVFGDAMIKPIPDFVRRFLQTRRTQVDDQNNAVRDLYVFLLNKRYYERLNLLYFAFDIFSDETPIPEAIVNETPFPHEDGIPKYKHHMDPEFRLP